MKRILTSLWAVLLTALLLCACTVPSNNSNNPAATNTPANAATPNNTGSTSSTGQKLRIVATTFPQYDWVREILGDTADNVELTLLLDDGVDLHSYQPTVEDIAKVSSSDMFIYVGGESDAWVPNALESATNKNMVVINLLETLGDGVKEEEIIEGMEHTHEHSHEEVDPDDIHDRPLSDWQGDWTTVEKALESGSMDEYVGHQAAENEMDFDAQKAAYAQRWQSDYPGITITDTSINFSGASSAYRYIGYKLVESDHGASVWYGFEAEDTSANAPLFIAFSDHGTGGDHEHEGEEEHDEHEEEHEDHTPHFHLRYGNESFDALIQLEGWSPTYFAAEATNEQVAEAMSGHGHSHEHEQDEHVWLSLKNAQAICAEISAQLQKLDAANADAYAANTQAYVDRLAQLDKDYQSAIDSASVKTLLFGDRFPFRYLVDDYGIEYFAAFSGCSAETEASFETVVFLANKVNELTLKTVMVIDGSDQSIAKTIVQNTTGKDQNIYVLDSMQSTSAKDISAGATYFGIMESNLAVLKEALQ